MDRAKPLRWPAFLLASLSAVGFILTLQFGNDVAFFTTSSGLPAYGPTPLAIALMWGTGITFVAAFALFVVIMFYRTQSQNWADAGRCPACGYQLTDAVKGCPECGEGRLRE